jgi:hypothetical protein
MSTTIKAFARSLVAAVILLATLLIPQQAPAFASPDGKTGILPPGSNYGMTNSQWSAKWWQWALGQPVATNPLLDTTGAQCTVGQSGPVWFLAGTFGDTVTRTCTILAGKAIFIPVANVFWSAEGTASQMRRNSRESMDSATNLQAEVDGIAVEHLQRYRVKSPTFTLTLPEDNVFGGPSAGVPAGQYSPTAADGIYLMLAPLPPGAHTIHVHAQFPGTGGNPPSITDVTYNLTVSA